MIAFTNPLPYYARKCLGFTFRAGETGLFQFNGLAILGKPEMPRDKMANPGTANRNQRLGGRSWVYFAQRGPGGPIKIGRTRQLSSRITALQSVCPEEVTLIGRIPETDLTEARVHSVFNEHRIRGEWFHPAPEILALAVAGERIYAAGYCQEIPNGLDGEWLVIQSYRHGPRVVGAPSAADRVGDLVSAYLGDLA